ncbi:MAG: type II toxin-antitoxin system RelE/ParE family toxin [bacterium]|nr:type II toxin-antitoxin system RelE/ParE family toxin [bacterium]
MSRFHALILDEVEHYVGNCPENDQVKIKAAMVTMEKGDFQSVHTKLLQGPIKELIVKNHRLIFFIIPPRIYFVRGFRKKSQKTPKHEIESALKKYKFINK